MRWIGRKALLLIMVGIAMTACHRGSGGDPAPPDPPPTTWNDARWNEFNWQ